MEDTSVTPLLQNQGEDVTLQSPTQGPEVTTPKPPVPGISPDGDKLLARDKPIIGTRFSAAYSPDPTDRSNKGPAQFTAQPSERDIQVLRENQSDPQAAEEFNSVYGANAAAQYLNFAPKKDIETLLQNRNDPDAMKEFDAVYGRGMSSWYAQLYDPKTGYADRVAAANNIQSTLRYGMNISQAAETSSIGEAIGSFTSGTRQGVRELGQSAIDGILGAFGPGLSDETKQSLLDLRNKSDLGAADTRILQHPIINGLIEGVTQFATGQIAANAVVPGSGFARMFATGALSDAFAFDPNDPLVGDMLKVLGKAAGLPDDVTSKIYSVEDLDTNLEKRAARAAEGGAIGLALEGLVRGLVKGFKASSMFKAGDKEGATKAADEAAKLIDEATSPKEASGKPQEAPNEVPGTTTAQNAKKPPTASVEAPEGIPAAANDNRVATGLPPAEETPVAKIIDDAVEHPAVREVEQGISGPTSVTASPQSPLRAIVDAIPDLPAVPARQGLAVQTIEAVSPQVDNFLALMKQTEPEQIIRSLEGEFGNIAQATVKLNSLTSLAETRVSRMISDAVASSKSLKGAELDNMLTRVIPELNVLKSKIDALHGPLGTAASDAMRSRKTVSEAVNADVNRLRIDALKEQGMSNAQIAQHIHEAIEEGRVKAPKLKPLLEERSKAEAIGDVKAVSAVDKKIEKAAKKAAKALENGVGSRLDRTLKTLVEWKLNAMLSGVKTLLINNPVGMGVGLTVHNASMFIGAALRAGVPEALALRAAKRTALFKANDGYVRAIKNSLNKAMHDTWLEKNSLQGAEVYAEGNHRAISAKSLGVSNKTLGKAVDVVGKAVRIPALLTDLPDQALGRINAHWAIGAEEWYKFGAEVAKRVDEVERTLAGEGLTPARREDLLSELRNLKSDNPTLTSGGKSQTLQDRIADRLDKAFDENGTLIDEAIIRENNIATFKEATGDTLDRVMSNDWTKLLVQAFHRSPLNEVKQSFQMIPGVSLLSKRFRDDLRGLNGQMAQDIARGKWVIGSVTASTLFLYASSGMVTGSGPLDAQARKSKTQGGWPGPNMIYIPGAGWYSYANWGSVGKVMMVAANIVQSMSETKLAINQDELLSRASSLSELISILITDKSDVAGKLATQSALSIPRSFLDSTYMQGFKQIIDMVSIFNSDDSTGPISKFFTNQTTGFIPALVKDANNAFDPRAARILSIADAWNAAFFNKDAVPKQYNALGKMVVSETPLRGYIGFFDGVQTKDMTNDAFVQKSLSNLTTLTGDTFLLNTKYTQKGVSVELAKVKSALGPDTVADRVAELYATIRIGGKTVSEALYEAIKHRSSDSVAGTNKFSGPLSETIKSTMAAYRDAAMATAVENERRALVKMGPSEMQKLFDKANNGREFSLSPGNQSVVPPPLGQSLYRN